MFVIHLLALFGWILMIRGQTEYMDAPVSSAGSCNVDCCLGCLKETLQPTTKILSKCTVLTRLETYTSECGYLGSSQCPRNRTSTYQSCENVEVTYNKVEVTCTSGCTCLDLNIYSSPDET